MRQYQRELRVRWLEATASKLSKRSKGAKKRRNAGGRRRSHIHLDQHPRHCDCLDPHPTLVGALDTPCRDHLDTRNSDSYGSAQGHHGSHRPCSSGIQERVQTIFEDDFPLCRPQQACLLEPKKALETSVPQCCPKRGEVERC